MEKVPAQLSPLPAYSQLDSTGHGSAIMPGGCMKTRPMPLPRDRGCGERIIRDCVYRPPIQLPRIFPSPAIRERIEYLEAKKEVALKNGNTLEVFIIEQEIAALKRRSGEGCSHGGFQGIFDQITRLIGDLLEMLRDFRFSQPRGPEPRLPEYRYRLSEDKPSHGRALGQDLMNGESKASGRKYRQVMPS